MRKTRLFLVSLGLLGLTSCGFDAERMAFVLDDKTKTGTVEENNTSSDEPVITYKTPTKPVEHWQNYTQKQFYEEDFFSKPIAYQFTAKDIDFHNNANKYNLLINLFEDGEVVISQYIVGGSIYFDYYGYWANLDNESLYMGVSCYSMGGSVVGISYSYNLTKTAEAFDTFGVNIALGFKEGGVFVRNTDINGTGEVKYATVKDFEDEISFTRGSRPAYDDPNKEETKTVQAVMDTTSLTSTMTLFTDHTFQFDYKSSAASITELGTWSYEEDVFAITINDGETITATLDGDTYTLNYVAKTSNRIKADFTITKEALEPKEENLLLSWNGDSENYILEFYRDGTYYFEFKSYNVKENGRWIYKDNRLYIINSANVKIEASLDASTSLYTLNYVSGVSNRLKRTFTLAGDIWKPALGDTGTFNALLLSWNGDSENYVLDFYSNGNYHFEFKSYSVKEDGTWSYVDSTLTVTNSAGVVLTPSLDSETSMYTLEYVSGISDKLKRTFTLEADVWKAALGDTGSFVI